MERRLPGSMPVRQLTEARWRSYMHNPVVRRKTVDGVLRGVGTFATDQGFVVVTGFETGGEPIVRRSQFIERYNTKGQLKERIFQPMRFEMIEKDTFRKLAVEAGFEIENVFGDYEAMFIYGA